MRPDLTAETLLLSAYLKTRVLKDNNLLEFSSFSRKKFSSKPHFYKLYPNICAPMLVGRKILTKIFRVIKINLY